MSLRADNLNSAYSTRGLDARVANRIRYSMAGIGKPRRWEKRWKTVESGAFKVYVWQRVEENEKKEKATKESGTSDTNNYEKSTYGKDVGQQDSRDKSSEEDLIDKNSTKSAAASDVSPNMSTSGTGKGGNDTDYYN